MPMRYQIFDLPRIDPIVTEYVMLRGICSGCGRKHHGALPAGVPSGQLGPRALALVGTTGACGSGSIPRVGKWLLGCSYGCALHSSTISCQPSARVEGVNTYGVTFLEALFLCLRFVAAWCLAMGLGPREQGVQAHRLPTFA